MAGEVSPGDYKDVVLFLATAGVVAPWFRRLKISPILGFLGAGVILGPSGLGALTPVAPWLSYLTIGSPRDIAQLAEFGVVFLLFMIGLELSFERLRALRRLVFGLGAIQVLVCGTAGALVARFLFHQSLASAATIGAALALSSTAVVMPLLTERKRQHSQAGRATFSVLLMQDLAVAPILVTLAVIGAASKGGGISPRLLLSFAPAIAGLGLLAAAGRFLLRPMMRSVAKAGGDELFMAASLLVVVGAGLLAAMSGLSMALGAFVAGLMLAETEFRHQVEVVIEPFKGLLLGLFFVSVGISLDLSLLVREPGPILMQTAGFILLNAGLIFGLARLFGLRRGPALEAGLLLAGSGEFAFVILRGAIDQGVVDRALGGQLLVGVTLSMFCLPLLAALGARLGGRPGAGAPIPAEAPDQPAEAAAVLIVGYGRVGRLVGDMMSRHGIPWIAAERDTRLVSSARREGASIFYGDASRPEFLRRCGLDTARAVVVTMDSPDANLAVVAAARELRADLILVARARDERHAKRLYELGATDAIPETIEASLQLAEAALVDMGVPMGLVIASIHQRRDEFRADLNRPDALGGRRRLRDARS
ncbi:MAG: potassium transporter TrkA [Caulobacteraceae bacterium]|nr:potassium transporter TrkA [Caulobacteraceae bacterium]